MSRTGSHTGGGRNARIGDGAFAIALRGESRDVDLGEEAHAVVTDVIAQLAVLTADGEVLTIVLTMPVGEEEQVIAAMRRLAETALARL